MRRAACMNPFRLPKRLKALADMIGAYCLSLPEDAPRTLADIGCDHAHLPLYLLREGVISYAVASDANAGPLRRAEENTAAAGFSERIRIVCADGLKGLLPGEVRMAVIAGMGGETIREILAPEETERTLVTEFFLSPQSKTAVLQSFLDEQGYDTVDARTVEDRGKRYLLWHVCRQRKGESHEMQ